MRLREHSKSNFDRLWIAAGKKVKERDYWLEKLSGGLVKSSFPYTYEKTNPEGKPAHWAALNFQFDKRRFAGLMNLSTGSDVRLHIVLTAILTLLLGKYSGNNDIIVGTPVMKTTGNVELINTVLALRNQLRDDMTCKELLMQVRQISIEANEHRNYPIEILLHQLNLPVPGEGKDFPLFDVALLLENIHDKKSIRETCPNILFSFLRTPDRIEGVVEYNELLYSRNTVEQIAAHLERLVDIVIFNVDLPISRIDILSGKEKKLLLLDFNNTRTVYPVEKTIDECFEEQAARVPHRTAVNYEGEPMNYHQLNKKADALAAYLHYRGVKTEEAVALMAENSLEVIVAILAILKAGGAYLPINSQYPAQRKKYILNDCKAKLLLTNCTDACPGVPTPGVEVIDLDDRGIYQYENKGTKDFDKMHSSDNLAYIMYTSGSTGTPKGVVVTHRNAVRLVKNCNFIQFKEDDSILLTGALEFDASTFEIWGALLNGLVLYLVNKDIILKHDRLKQVIAEKEVTTIWMTSPLFNRISDADIEIFAGLRNLLVGGDVLSPTHINRLRERFPGLNVINGYGPTENTTFSTTFLIDKEYHERIPIGKPISNSTAYILDSNLQLVPIGVIGELFVGGDGLSRGYLNNPELTNSEFQIPNKKETTSPHYPITPLPYSPIYRTGDRARWLWDGNIEFLGRVDFQVKIRGFRVEPGEIENRLMRHKNVKEALVVSRIYKNGEKYLCAYVVAGTREQGPGSTKEYGSTPTSMELREYLSGELPDYMVPAHFVVLERMPLNPHGKVDRKSLPEPEVSKTGAVYTPPRGEVEQEMAKIWSGVLDLAREPGIDDNFFELGGHSLKATTLVHRLYKEFGVNLEIEDVFTHPTIRELAQRMKELNQLEYLEIKPVEEKEYYEMSYAQRRLWVLCQFEEDATAYNMPAALTITGPFRVEVFTQAVQVLVRRHDSLRTIFIPVDGEPRQEIVKDLTFHLETVDLRTLDEETKEKKAREIYLADANRAFDLEKGPLFRFQLLQMEDERHFLIYNMHHIINDGWSQGIITNEIISLYNTFLKGGENPLASLKIQYKDYTRWHNRLIETDSFRDVQGYWLEKFKDKPNGIELPFDHPRKAIQTFNGGRVSFTIDKEKTSLLHQLSFEEDTTLFMILLTLVSIFLYRYSGQTDIIIGAPIANRRRIELNPIVGFLVNTLVYRNEINPGLSFKKQLKAVKGEALTCYQYQDYPFDLLVEQLELSRDLSQSPLFNVMLAHNNAETEDITLAMEGAEISHCSYTEDFNMSKFDLIFFMIEMDDQIHTSIEYNSDLFERGTIERMKENLLTLVEDAIARKNEPVSALKVLSRTQYETVVHRFNHTGYPFETLTLQELFENQVGKCRDKIAVSSPERSDYISITYSQLNKKINQLAYYLKEKCQVKPNDIIGVSVERSIDMIVVLWGIIKAGAAYLAVDPTYPRDRILHVLADSQSHLLIIDKMRPELFEGYPGEILNINTLQEEIQRESRENPPVVNQSSDILYVNYTSGSTGTPNGAMLSHDCLTNLIQWQKEKTTIDCSLSCLQFTSINFCVSFQEIMGTLVSGGKLHLIGDIERQDIGYLMNYLSLHQIEILFLPFSYLNFLFNESGRWDRDFRHNLKHIITAGEQLKVTAGLKRFLNSNPRLQLHNHYGSTEMHVVTSYTLDAATAADTPIPPAGKPINNVKIFILDEHFNPVPIGVYGELSVAGKSEILGYINNKELTGKKLLTQPELSRIKLYRSGDIGRWLPDGNIELRGRKDFLVKVRGFRVEPGEIESRILAIQGVRECVVVVREDARGQKNLAAYVSVDHIDAAEIKKIISNDLPQYMIPRIIILDSLPLMPNGKVDREALPQPEFVVRKKYEVPGDEVERKLVEIWSEVLGAHTSIRIDDNFFELGGHSLKATLMVSRIHKEFNVKISLVEIFTTPYIRGLAEKIRGKVGDQDRFAPLEPGEEKEYYILSSAQERLYILHILGKRTTAYNMPYVMELTGAVDEERLEKTFREMINRHESLRTSFRLKDEEPVQRIHDEVEFEIEYYDENFNTPRPLRGPPSQEGNKSASHAPCSMLHASTIKNFIRPFDLSQAPLLRVGLIKHDRERHILIVDMHHIISDGISLEIFVKEFMAVYGYGEKELPGLKVQYKDYAQWQKSEEQQEVIKKQEAYWIKEFGIDEQIPVLNLPIDYTRPVIQSFEGGVLGFEIDSRDTSALKRLAFGEGVTLYMVLLSIYTILLSKLSNQEDIVVGTPVAGRRHVELRNIIGMFVNTLALRNFPCGEITFKQFLREVKNRTLTAFAHQDYPYEDLVEVVAKERDASRNPLFDTLFALENMDIPEVEIPGLKVNPYDSENMMQTSKFDLSLIGVELEENLSFAFEYCTKLFVEETVVKFIKYFKKIVSDVINDNDRDIRIGEIEIISQEERKQLLYDFNDTEAAYPHDKMIHEIFAEQVEQNPANIAVIGMDHGAWTMEKHLEGTRGLAPLYITYRELNKKSNQLAHILIEKGVKPDTIVGIMIERSIEMIIGILGILKSGGAYLPIDPDYPHERIHHMLADSKVKILVEKDNNFSEIRNGQELFVLNFEHLNFEFRASNLDLRTSNLAYIMYTSGSTGRPKGVLVTHGNVLRLVKNANYIPLTEETRILQTGAPVFDATTFEIWGSLLNGGQLVLTDKEVILNAHRLAKTLKEFVINTLWLSSPLFNQLMQQNIELFSPLHYLLVGGDVLSPAHINRVRYRFPKLNIINGYGPTENTTFSTTYLIEKEFEQNIPIGSPINNSFAYIVDKNNHLQPMGIWGELCLGGDGVSLGYINSPELTAERYIENPFEKGSHLYRTGDLARWLPDGNIEFLGRMDQQIKIRGFRVELGEIENRLFSHEAVEDAVVMARTHPGGDKYLYAYIVASNGIEKTPGISELREYLAKTLPDYMIPSFFIPLPGIPLTPNGKVDRKALPEPEITTTENYVAPQDEIEEKLLEIWLEVLGASHTLIGIDDNFFQMGGHSLKAAIMKAKVCKKFDVDFSLAEIFKIPTIRGISSLIKAIHKASNQEINENHEFEEMII
ncbi:MAG: amino acid adenylation domain-containing protein [Candidatus Aminicenantes bacterium]|nr:MAG: amino acid adenylation domain-containing protein [Candidatus Aminicenantes bacterium]